MSVPSSLLTLLSVGLALDSASALDSTSALAEDRCRIEGSGKQNMPHVRR